MFRSLQPLQPSIYVAASLVIAATVYAVLDDKVANLLIGAAMVASTAAWLEILMDRRLGDAYDTGKRTERRAIARDVAELVEPARD